MSTRVCNDQVALAWAENRPAKNHKGTLTTDGKKIFSYDLQIGDTAPSGKKFVRDYTARGSYGFQSMTTSCHVGLLRYIRGATEQPIVV
tara:strand:+ start:1132 stop:1398 length:267 start_codon:yes stop_codon:yes gene_type:complete